MPTLRTGEGIECVTLRVGLSRPAGGFRGIPGDFRSWVAVTPTYLDARDPGVIWLVGIEGFVTVLGVVNGPVVTRRFAGVVRPAEGPIRELPSEGVTLPLGREGVTRPVEIEGVTLPEYDGVTRPLLLRTEATEGGRETMLVRTAGGESLSTATNTPHFWGQTKYLMLIRDVDQIV